MSRLVKAVAEYDASMAHIEPCSNHHCVIVPFRKGMATNGTCRCWENKYTAQRAMRAAYNLRRAIADINPAPVPNAHGTETSKPEEVKP